MSCYWLGYAKIVNYQKWSADIPTAITDDTFSLADQLYRATGGISANISKWYSYVSGKSQARFCEYALGSACEARGWYFKSRHQLGQAVVDHRFKLLARIIRQLLDMIPQYRGQSIKEEEAIYETTPLSELLQNILLPE